MKKSIYGGAFIFGAIGEVIGAGFDKGAAAGLGPWSLLLSAVGTIVGLYVGYKVGRYFDL